MHGPAGRGGGGELQRDHPSQVVGEHAIWGKCAREDRDLVDRALERIEALTEPTDERGPTSARQGTLGRGTCRKRAVHIQAQRRAVEGADKMRPRVQRKRRSVHRQERATCGAHTELRDARFEEQHVLAVHRAVDGLLEDAAVLPRERRTDPGLDGYGIRKIEHRGRCDAYRRTGAREGRGGIAGNGAGLTEAHSRVDRT